MPDQFAWPLPAGNRLFPGPERERAATDLRQRYEDGKASIRELIALTGRSYGFVYRLLAESGAVFRPRGGDQRSMHHRTALRLPAPARLPR
ncbi:helix-turn-helix domain-containing protein [Streptomyces cinerochromogenes]|uniref:helix-turn-helix domain-containing protein n=1 Tax=Streptomyces cinerochromogenes TaxID=66422 RepID=UPI0036AE1C21